jgi:exopolyphosphatase / guanosine-5'-triphosphate,3'-diphosphate pyrophosphatase
MEIVLGRDAEPELAMSLPLGAGRLTRLFLPDDPPSRDQLAALRRHVNATLRESPTGCSGRGFRNVPSVPPRPLSSWPVFPARPPAEGPFCPPVRDSADLEAWIPRLATLRARERAKLQGVSRSRSRQIVAGAIAARAGMKALNVGSVDICPWALREGIILHYLQAFNQSFDLPLRPLNGSAYAQDAPGGRHVTLVTTSSG